MFRYTIRELVLLTAAAALGVGWWVSRAEGRRADRELRSALAQLKLKDTVIDLLESDRRDFARRALEAESTAAEHATQSVPAPGP
jgi:hypothetical protein